MGEAKIETSIVYALDRAPGENGYRTPGGRRRLVSWQESANVDITPVFFAVFLILCCIMLKLPSHRSSHNYPTVAHCGTLKRRDQLSQSKSQPCRLCPMPATWPPCAFLGHDSLTETERCPPSRRLSHFFIFSDISRIGRWRQRLSKDVHVQLREQRKPFCDIVDAGPRKDVFTRSVPSQNLYAQDHRGLKKPLPSADSCQTSWTRRRTIRCVWWVGPQEHAARSLTTWMLVVTAKTEQNSITVTPRKLDLTPP